MSRLYFLLPLILIFLASACDDDDSELGRITIIGRNDGWAVENINSDFRAKYQAAIDGTDDAVFTAADTTRTAVAFAYEEQASRLIDVEACDRDDAIFFFGDGEILNAKLGTDCPDDRSVTDPFNQLFYSSDLNVDNLRLRDARGQAVATYAVSTLNESEWVFSRTVSVADTLIGNFNYELEYELRAR